MSAIAAARAAAIRGRTRGNMPSAAAPVATQPASSGTGEIDPEGYEAGSPFLSSSLAVAAAQNRCAPGPRGDQSCLDRVDTSGDPNTIVICAANYRCALRCAQGFAPTDGANSGCVPEPDQCKGEPCKDIANGYVSCFEGSCFYSEQAKRPGGGGWRALTSGLHRLRWRPKLCSRRQRPVRLH